MSYMSELDIAIRERTAEKQSPAEIAKALGIPAHWVTEMIEEDAYNDYNELMNKRADEEFAAEQYADEDALNYGTR